MVSSTMRSRLLRPINLLVAVFYVLGLMYSVTTPLFEGPDEIGHYGYVRYVASGKGLPVQSFDRSQIITYEGHQPPLYYAVSALSTFWVDTSNEADVYRQNPAFVWGSTGREPNLVLHTAAEGFPFHGVSLAMHIVRALSVLFGAVTVWGTYQLGKLATHNEVISLGAAALVAFNPQFLFSSGVINNDSALVAFFTLALLMLTSILLNGRSRRRAIWLGVWIGLALLSKSAALILGPLAFFVIVVVAIRERSWRVLPELVLWSGIPVVLISGWWFVRNQILYGDPLGYQMFLATNGTFAPWDFSQVEGWKIFAELTHRSFWGQFGWMTIQLDRTLYDLFAGLYVFAVLGAVVGTAWRRELDSTREAKHPVAWLFFASSILLLIAWMIGYASVQGGSGLQGRYLFPVVSVIALLIISGVSAIVPDHLRHVPIAVVVGGLAILALSVPSQYIAPAYRFFTLPESALESVPHRLNGTFSPEIALAGYRLENQSDHVWVTLYWHSQGTPSHNYKVFIHALNSQNELCGQRDALPQSGAFLMSSWRTGDVIEDIHSVPLNTTCCANGGCRLSLGLYREDTGERLLYSVNGRPVSDHIEIQVD